MRVDTQNEIFPFCIACDFHVVCAPARDYPPIIRALYIIIRIFKNNATHSLFGQVFPRPARMVRFMQIGLGMGHNEKPARRIANPGNGQLRTIGIVGIFDGRLLGFGVNVEKTVRLPLLTFQGLRRLSPRIYLRRA